VADEIIHFKSKGWGDRIIAAIVDGEPGSERECFPEPLKRPVGPDGRLDRTVNAEPIAADFRLEDGSEGFTSAEGYRLALRKDLKLKRPEVEQRADKYDAQLQLMKLKLIAGILGVPLEQLRDRDKAYQLQLAHQRTRALRRWLVAVVMLAVPAVAGGVYAYIKHGEEVTAQRRTVTEMIDASWKAATFFTDSTDETSFGKTRTYIYGTRQLYSQLRIFMDLGKLQSLSAVPVFLSGPHPGSPRESGAVAAGDFNNQSYDFGHYNPEFVKWVYANVIPASEDQSLRQFTQPFYDKLLREISRYYDIVWIDIQAAEPLMTQEVIPHFKQDLEKCRDVPFNNGMGTGPGKYLQYTVFDKYSEQFACYNSDSKSVSIFPSSSGELDVYYAGVEGSFWIRRLVDGTSPDFVRVPLKLLNTYDHTWLSTAPEAQPGLRHPIELSDLAPARTCAP
jgi:hypothetical protein